MRRFLAMVLLLCLMGTMVGCANKNPNNGNENAANALSRGTINGDLYSSEFIGLNFTKPKGWIYSTDEDIASMMQISSELLQTDKFVEQVAKMSTVYDMMAKDPLSGNNINVVFENLKVSGSSNITVEQYIEVAKKQLIQQAPMLGYKFGEAEKCKLGELEFYRVPADGSYSGVQFNQRIYMRKEGTYMIVITLTLFDKTDGATIEKMFY